MSESSEARTQAPAASKRDRSPNYPGIGPSEALKFAEMIWKRDKRNPVSTDMACQHMGYKAKNGASLPVIAALKRYGLLISVGPELRISDEAHTIFLAPEGHPERIALIKKMAMRPALFGEVLARFPDGLPSDQNLRFRLRNDWDFANDKAADNFIASLKDAVALAGVAPPPGSADTADEDSAKDPVQMPPEQAISNDPGRGAVPPALLRPSAPLPSGARSWDLGGGALMTVSLPAKLSKLNIGKLKKYIAALEMEASIAWDDEEEPGPTSE